MRHLLSSTVAAVCLAAGLPAFAQPPVPPPAGRPPLVQSLPPGGQVPPGAQAVPRVEPGVDAWQAHPALGPTVRDETFNSPSLGRQMKYRVVLPAGYDVTARRYPVLYLLHGLWGGYTDWESKTQLVEHLRPYRLIVVMPDAGDSWYTNSAGVPADRFEDYIAKDLVQDVEGRFRVMAERHGRAIAGLSMGGYGAVKFGLKYPGSFAFAAGFSGAHNVTQRPRPAGSKPSPMFEAMARIYGPAGSETRTANDVLALAAKADPEKVPYFYIDCGTEDGLLSGNRDLVAALQKQKVAYEYREVPGAHTWTYWDRQLPEMLRVLAAHVDVR